MEIKFFNTLTRKKEAFKPLKKNQAGIYSCGPTVYYNQHIGHMYAYVQWDVLVRFLKFAGYKTKWIMNITDVGHLTSDEDSGEDKMEKGAHREGLSVKQIADKYIKQFKESLKDLNINKPDVFCRATHHIKEQIELAKKIENRGFAYKTKTGLVFDTAKFSNYAKFAKLNLKKQSAGKRVEIDPNKKNPWDFLLWITNQPKHILKWKSPWGIGFPGWHLECTAMSTKYLGSHFDVHTGGKEHIPIHHTNEIAQAFGAFGKQTANYWLHNDWLTVKNQKMSKSQPKTLILTSDLKNKGFSPIAFRYLIISSHYRQGLDFSWESLEGAQTAINRLYENLKKIKKEKNQTIKLKNDWQNKFIKALADDLNTAKGLALLWQLIKDKKTPSSEKLKLALDWDKVFGLKIKENLKEKPKNDIPEEIFKLTNQREKARQEKNWIESDRLRKKINELGYQINDTKEGQKIEPIKNYGGK